MGSGKEEVASQVETSSPELGLLVFSSPKSGSLDSGASNRIEYSDRCPPMTPSVSSELEGEAGLAGWIGAFGHGSVVFLF